jgi:hypothetical protein
MSASQEIDKYTHLLQPIRDLAANWNINIANELGEYLVRSLLQGLLNKWPSTTTLSQLPIKIKNLILSLFSGSIRRHHLLLSKGTTVEFC